MTPRPIPGALGPKRPGSSSLLYRREIILIATPYRPCDRGQCLTVRAPLDRLGALVLRELELAPELHARRHRLLSPFASAHPAQFALELGVRRERMTDAVFFEQSPWFDPEALGGPRDIVD